MFGVYVVQVSLVRFTSGRYNKFAMRINLPETSNYKLCMHQKDSCWSPKKAKKLTIVVWKKAHFFNGPTSPLKHLVSLCASPDKCMHDFPMCACPHVCHMESFCCDKLALMAVAS